MVWRFKLFLIFKERCLKQRNATFTPSNLIFFIVYELDIWSRDLHFDFTLKDYLFKGVKLAKDADPDKYSYSGYGIGFDSRSLFHFQILTGVRVDMTSSVHIDNKKKDILILEKGPTQGLDVLQ